jgi:uncharacterized small protein (DUF1192 family)
MCIFVKSRVVGLKTPASFTRELRARATRSAMIKSALHIVIEPTFAYHTMMSITELEQRCNALRNDLKAWEKQFAAQHNGQKAGREDIKADAVICTHTTC